MAKYDYDMGIIGGGAAGLTVASGAAQLGGKTLLIEKEEALGGDCLHFGCVPSKTLIKTAHVYHQMKNGPLFGLPAIEPPPVDFRDVSGRIRSVIGVIQKHDSVERFCKLGARVEFGEPEFRDEHVVSLNGKAVSAKNWLIATGSSAAAPPIEGLDTTPYLTNREIFYPTACLPLFLFLAQDRSALRWPRRFAALAPVLPLSREAFRYLARKMPTWQTLSRKSLQRKGLTF